MPHPANRYSYRFAIARNAEHRWEITDHEKNEVEELISDEEICGIAYQVQDGPSCHVRSLNGEVRT